MAKMALWICEKNQQNKLNITLSTGSTNTRKRFHLSKLNHLVWGYQDIQSYTARLNQKDQPTFKKSIQFHGMSVQFANTIPIIQKLSNHKFCPIIVTFPTLVVIDVVSLPLLNFILKQHMPGGALFVRWQSLKWTIIHNHFQETGSLWLIRKSQHALQDTWLWGRN